MTGSAHIEVDHFQRPKHGQAVAGDVFLSQRIKEEERLVAVLSDGLGSGVKASVLATLTATMALRYTSSGMDIRKSAETIMDTLPICSVRKISYSTFTIVDVTERGAARVIEHGNPPFVLLRGEEVLPVRRSTLVLDRWQDRPLAHAELELQLGDRVLFFSDGVSQSGMGHASMPLGWTSEEAVAFAQQLIREQPEISARQLARAVVDRSWKNDGLRCKDDISCGVVYFRHPRRLLVMTGPPFSRGRDPELAELVQTFPGRKAICGGTTASIVARQLGRSVQMRTDDLDPEIPPSSSMEGVDLITEGTLTLSRVAELLENDMGPEGLRANAARELLALMLESDVIDFVVGTRINEAHQDPNIPVELDIRRNVVKKIVALLEQKHVKQVAVRMI